jgi:hypothetical protein
MFFLPKINQSTITPLPLYWLIKPYLNGQGDQTNQTARDNLIEPVHRREAVQHNRELFFFSSRFAMALPLCPFTLIHPSLFFSLAFNACIFCCLLLSVSRSQINSQFCRFVYRVILPFPLSRPSNFPFYLPVPLTSLEFNIFLSHPLWVEEKSF